MKWRPASNPGVDRSPGVEGNPHSEALGSRTQEIPPGCEHSWALGIFNELFGRQPPPPPLGGGVSFLGKLLHSFRPFQSVFSPFSDSSKCFASTTVGRIVAPNVAVCHRKGGPEQLPYICAGAYKYGASSVNIYALLQQQCSLLASPPCFSYVSPL